LFREVDIYITADERA
jgi:hypothetical protein